VSKGVDLPLYVGISSSLNGHLYLEGVGGTDIGLDSLYLWLLFLEIWTGTLPKTEPMCQDSVASARAPNLALVLLGLPSSLPPVSYGANTFPRQAS